MSTERKRRTSEPEQEVQEVTEPMHVKYRPRKLADVYGQAEVVKSLAGVLKDKARPHAFLFCGPAGTGKTTLARILASEFKVAPSAIQEVDAATNRGIDAMRELTSSLRYQGFGETPNRAIIIDECHQLTKEAWDSLLKSVEEPPEHVFFFFCTTNQSKVPATVVTRCLSYTLKPVRCDEVLDLLEEVAEDEKLKVSDAILGRVAQACAGSPRRALTMLAKVANCDDEDEARVLLEQPDEDVEIIDLCRLLVSGKLNDWKTITEKLKAVQDVGAEGIRIVIVNYLNACLMGSKGGKDTTRLLDMLYVFSKQNYNPADKLAPLLLAFGDLLFGN